MEDATDNRDAPELTTAAYVVLGMVRIGARTGYEIKQLTAQSIRYFWTISPVQIYPSLTQLEAARMLGLGVPQVQRLCAAVRRDGADGLSITATGYVLP